MILHCVRCNGDSITTSPPPGASALRRCPWCGTVQEIRNDKPPRRRLVFPILRKTPS